MDKVLNAEQADAKAFEDAKYDAEQEIKAFVNAIDYNAYSDEAIAEISAYVEAAMTSMEEATVAEDFAVIVAELKANIESVAKLPTAPTDSTDSTDSSSDTTKKGCGSVVGLTTGVTLMAAAAAVVLRKKKED